jgi:hypothetical protein
VYDWCKCLVVVDPLLLGVALGYPSGFVLLDRAISMMFDLEDPSGANCLAISR